MFRHLIMLGLAMSPMLVAAGSFERVVYFVNDYDGSVIHEVSEAGSVLRSIYHAPYGGDYYRVDETPAEQTFGYAGSLVQAEGLVNMGYRFYDPQIGRFLSPDPVSTYRGGIQHFGRYHYANNNPYKYNDPDGRVAQFFWGAAIGIGVEVLIQTTIQGRAFTEIDLTDVAVAAGAGALTGGIASTAALAAAKGSITVGRAVGQTAVGAGAVAVNASLVGDVANGEMPDAAGAVVDGVAAAALGAVGQRLALGPLAELERIAKNGVGSHVSEVTFAAKSTGSDAVKYAAMTSSTGSNAADAMGVAAETFKAGLEEKQ